MATAEKIATVAEIKEKLSKSAAFIVTNYRGLTANEMVDLRKKLFSAQVDYKIYKNTLMRRAVADLNIDELKPILKGPTAIAFSAEDAIAPSKVLDAFAKEHKALQIYGGVAEKKFIDVSQIKVLAKLPGRKDLLSMLVGALSGNTRKLVYVLDQIAKQKDATK
jgi:large subunit ribosomal protein L10